MDRFELTARKFQALSVPTRIQILCLLKNHSFCVGALAGQLNITQGAVSQHLRILKDTGFVIAERKGCRIHYKVNPKSDVEWGEVLKNVFSQCEGLVDNTGELPCVERKRDAKNRKN